MASLLLRQWLSIKEPAYSLELTLARFGLLQITPKLSGYLETLKRLG